MPEPSTSPQKPRRPDPAEQPVNAPGHLLPAAHGPPPQREHLKHLHAHPLVVVLALVAMVFASFWAFKLLAEVLAR